MLIGIFLVPYALFRLWVSFVPKEQRKTVFYCRMIGLAAAVTAERLFLALFGKPQTALVMTLLVILEGVPVVALEVAAVRVLRNRGVKGFDGPRIPRGF